MYLQKDFAKPSNKLTLGRKKHPSCSGRLTPAPRALARGDISALIHELIAGNESHFGLTNLLESRRSRCDGPNKLLSH